jgi:peptidyl-prolyl cis-trans isomerase SurA
MTSKLICLLLAAAIAATAQTEKPASKAQSLFQDTAVTASGKAVVRINGTVLTDRDLLREMNVIFPYAQQHGGKFPQAMEADIRRGALDMMEFEELVYQEAVRRNLKVPPARLDHAMKVVRDQFGSPDDFHAYLKSGYNDSLKLLRETVHRSILIDELLQTEVTRKATVSESQVQEFFRKNPARFYSPEVLSIQTISLVIPDHPTPQQDADVRNRAEEILRQASKTRNYEEFGMLAEKVSEDDWRVMMGDHRFITREQMPPEVAKIAFKMKDGQMSQLIRAENSWCIVRFNAHQDARWVRYDEIKTSLKRELETEKIETLRREFHQQLRKNAKVEEL